MIVKCIYNKMSEVPGMPRCGESENVAFENFLWKGSVYGVYGINVCKNRINYFVCNEGGVPTFLPSWFFEILDNSIPRGWKVSNTACDEKYRGLYEQWDICLLAGYAMLVDSVDHYDGLLDRDKDALQEFYIAKKKMDMELYGKLI